MFTEGCLRHAGSLYVAAPPSIWKLTDGDDDGVADERQECQGKTLTGCTNAVCRNTGSGRGRSSFAWAAR
ncbi:MAG: hypothetical protein M2R45_02203 [Verrucomicrobia subdivision 3 bacterium]|nr:hypothetical protein [Limisphaerales bacterium]